MDYAPPALYLYLGMTNYRIGPHRITSDHIGLHRTTSDHVWPCLQTRERNFISEAKMRCNYLQANKPPGTQLAHYNLCRHKSSIRPRSSVAYMSGTQL